MKNDLENKIISIMDNYDNSEMLAEFLEYVNDRAPELVEEWVNMAYFDIQEYKDSGMMELEPNDLDEDMTPWSYKGVF